jgi:hypothetical protein
VVREVSLAGSQNRAASRTLYVGPKISVHVNQFDRSVRSVLTFGQDRKNRSRSQPLETPLTHRTVGSEMLCCCYDNLQKSNAICAILRNRDFYWAIPLFTFLQTTVHFQYVADKCIWRTFRVKLKFVKYRMYRTAYRLYTYMMKQYVRINSMGLQSSCLVDRDDC